MGNKTLIAVHLTTFDVNAYNNYLGFKGFNVVKAIKDSSYFNTQTGFTLDRNVVENIDGKDKYASFTGDIRGPSLLIGIKKLQLGFFWNRVRFGMQFSGIDEKLARNIYNISKATVIDVANLRFTENRFSLNINAWSEQGVSGAFAIVDNKDQMLRIGLTVKSLNGLGAFYLTNGGTTFTFFKHSTDLDSSLYANYDMEIGFTNEFSYAEKPLSEFQLDTFTSSHSDFKSKLVFDNLIKNQKRLGKGLGVDLGVVYEKRNGKKGAYLFRAAASLVDIGSIKYNNPQSAYVTHYKGNNEVIITKGLKGFNSRQYDTAIASHLLTTSGAFKSFTMALPTSLNLSFDYRIVNHVYVNASLIQSVRSKFTQGIRMFSSLSVSPRFETRWFSATMPFILNDGYRNPNLGLCISALNSLYIGSDNIGGAFGIGKVSGLDIYGGASINIYKHKKKKKVKKEKEVIEVKLQDRDKDGVPDNLDECPDIFGLPSLKGCPDLDEDGVTDKNDSCPTLPGTIATFGCPDEDRDSIADKEDRCPTVFGVLATHGCPDKDEDGIADMEDRCPDMKGPLEWKGCPDTDGDSLVDIDDECPDMKGPIALKGCPDTDGDGFADKNDSCPTIPGKLNGCPDKDEDGLADATDKCPDIPGTLEMMGCPDSDSDRVNDADDQCPLIAGTAANFGCPEKEKDVVKVEKVNLNADDKKILEEAFKSLEFASSKSEIKKESELDLDKIVEIMKRNPAYRLLIVGHTDNAGSSVFNKSLSLSRANAVKTYMVSKGIAPENFITKGYGPDRPVASNSTEEGKQRNRRVEMTIVK